MRQAIRVASAALVLLGSACAREPGDASPLALPPEGADIVGAVTAAGVSGERVVVTIEQDSTRSAGYPIATVTVGPDARVLRRAGEGIAAARPSDLVVGARVRAWFTGPVRESWPVQADAGTVLIEP